MIIATSDLKCGVSLSLTAVEGNLSNLESGSLNLAYPDNS